MLAVSAPGAGADDVTIGSSLGGTFDFFRGCGAPCTFAQSALAGAALTSPIDGAVVTWGIRASATGEYRLRVLNPKGGLEFAATGTSAPVTPLFPGVPELFETALPIKAGQTIGVDLDANATISVKEKVTGATSILFNPSLADGSSGTGVATNGVELQLAASIQPPPTIVEHTPVSGPFEGGNAVVISGTDLANASAVSFGGVAAAKFTVDSRETITAVVPVGRKAGQAAVSVTTPAGTATSPTPYLYDAPIVVPSAPCRVPKLKGRKLKAAKRMLKRFHCSLGKVRKKNGATAGTGKVARQRPKPGTVLRGGAKVRVTLE